MAIDGRVQAFAGLLRENGVRVSTAELVDAGRALGAVGLSRRETVRAALRTTLVKRSGDVPVFDRLFALFFDAGDSVAAAAAGSLLAALSDAGLDPDTLERLATELDAGWDALDPLTRALLAGQRAQLARLLGRASLQLDLPAMESFMQQGLFSQRLLQAAGVGRVERDLDAVQTRLEEAAPGDADAIRSAMRAHLASLRAAARRLVEQDYQRRHLPRDAGLPGYRLEERPLYTLSRDEIERMKAVVERLAERLRDRIERKRKKVRRGHFDVQKTMRKSLKYGGLPMEPVFRKKKPHKPDLVVLVDVSDSVRNVARFFLQFAYTLQDVFDRVRSFVFVSDLGEATALFRDADVHRAVDLAFTGRVISLYANSNYGRALQMFHREYLAAVSSRTTVFVLGDGRNNYNAPADWVLRDIRRRARRLVWLCPESRSSWGFGDSEMPTYARHCDWAEVVQKVSDLSRIMEQVIG